MNFSKISHGILFFFALIIAALAAVYPVPDSENAATEVRDKREGHDGVAGPVHTYIKTDKNANFKWGVRHHVGHHFAGRK